ncbi:MAG: hypothetical protein ACYCVD_07705 [Desulfitobacteriaceae bacterium]
MLYLDNFYVASKIGNNALTKGAFYKVLALTKEDVLVCDDKQDLLWINIKDVSVASQPEKLFSSMEMASGIRNGVLKTAKFVRTHRKKED